MNKKLRRTLSCLVAAAMLGGGSGIQVLADDAVTVTLNPAEASPFNDGRFQGWGTSLCWWANRVGYSDKLTQAASDAFFSEDGLGLDIARYNLGGGDDPTHNHITRSDSKVPGVWSEFELSEDGTDVNITKYDITKDQNQLNVAKAALAANPNLYFEGFSNSAPYFMTVTGCSSGGDPASSDNLKSDMYDDFGRFIADATQLFRDEGIVFRSYSPMNEPQTSYWGVNSWKQEGCHFDQGTSQSNAIIQTRKALDDKGLTDVAVAGMDETSIDTSITSADKLSDEAKSALGRLDTHTYGGSKRAELKEKAKELGKDLWMSEVDAGGDGAVLADMIIADMNGMQPAAWVMWDIVDKHKDATFTAPDGTTPEADVTLAYTDSIWGVGLADHDTETLTFSNKYYAYGQFTRYINPGDTIIASSDKTLAAYNKETGDIKIVAHNSGDSDLSYKFDLSAFQNPGTAVKEIRSDMAGDEKWAEITGEAEIADKILSTTLKAHTVTTYVIAGENKAGVSEFDTSDTDLSYSYSAGTDTDGADKFFAVYGKDGTLKAVTMNKPSGTLTGDFTDCTFKLMAWDGSLTPTMGAVDELSSGGAKYAVITGSESEIKRGAEVQLTCSTSISGAVTWSTDNETVAAISQDGLLSAKMPGTVTITATVGGFSVSATYDITVYATITGANRVRVGGTEQLTLDTNALETPVWSVSDRSVATVTQDGLLTALSHGTVDVTVTVGDVTAVKTIAVKQYELSGTPSWCSSGSVPPDDTDYTKAADGDLDTYFDGNQNGYVMYDFGEPVKLDTVKLAARSGHEGRTTGANIQASNDAIDWTDIYTVTGTVPSGAYTELSAADLDVDGAYRYYRYINTTTMTNIAEFIVTGSAEAADSSEPAVTDIDELTDDFEGSSNIFQAEAGDLTSDGTQVFASSLARFGSVLAPVRSTARVDLTEAVAVSENDRFRLKFNMFSGWENNGKDNEFSLLDSDGEELVGFTITGGGYNLNQMRIGGTDVLADTDDKPVFQCMASGTKGANGWDSSSQRYANNMGLNKTVEMVITGAGEVTVSMTGGKADLSYSGTIDGDIDVKSLILTGAYNSARGRVVSYDNFDADLITYAEALPTAAPPTPTPTPTSAPVVPDSGELINLSFDDGTLSSSSDFGKAEGTPVFADEDGKACIRFDGTETTAVKLTDANGNALLTGLDEFTVSFKVKPTVTTTSWWFFAAPNDNAQTYQQEKYIGCMTNGSAVSIERYNNSGSRSAAATGTYTADEWNDVIISFADGVTTLYINGVKSEQASSVDISDMLGTGSVVYIGKANWGSGEFATGYIDDFVVKTGAADIPTVELGDLSAVTSDLTLPDKADDNSAVTWTSSDTSVISNDGKVTRGDDTVTVTLTAEITKDGSVFAQRFTATVVGYLVAAESFAAYAEDKTITYFCDYDVSLTPYALSVTLTDESGTTLGTSDTASGSFSVDSCGTYKLICRLADGETVKSEVTRTLKVKEETETAAYLFAHFVGTESSATDEQIYFSVSQDGTSWTTLNDGSPILTSTVGEEGVRDPYILRGEDGKFFVIATDLSIYGRRGDSNRWSTCQTSGSQSLVVWESDDLVNWSEASLVKVAPDTAGCAWAPEAVYDAEKDAYMVFWASKVSDDNYATQRMYRSYTTDFETFTDPEIYIDGGTVSNIDTTITNYKGIYYRFTKNESKSTVTMMRSTSLSGNWENVDTYTLGDMTGYEGPTIYKLNGESKWCLLLDYYSKSKGYKPFVTDDITKGTFTAADDFNFDTTYRHGTVIPITQAEYDSLCEKY